MKNPTLLTLLKLGCRVEFPGGYYLSGDPSILYIDIGTQFGSEGLWSLDKDGIDNALRDIKRMEREDKDASQH